MTTSCGNSDDVGEETPSTSPDDTYEPGAVALSEGPVFVGENADDTLTTIATGDFNGDGQMDVALGAAFADGGDGPDAGKVYVFYSVAAYGSTNIPVGEADAIFIGQAGGQAGRALTAADINGDRVDDLIIGAPAAGADGRAEAGKVYVLLGNPVFESVRASELASGVPAITGADAGDFLGYTLTTGDFNKDGTSDLAIGAFLGDGPDNEREDGGEVHVHFGGDQPSNIDLASSTLDAVVYGANAGDRLGEALTTGDFNGDGRDDLVAAAPFGDTDDAEDTGVTYVLTDELRPINDTAGTVPSTIINGVDEGDQLGHSLAALDFDGDGLDDLLLGAVSADGPENGDDLAGEVALVRGTTEAASVDAATDAAIVYGVQGGRLGRAISAGDVTGDGLDDAVLCASEAPDEQGEPEAGGIYLFTGNPAAHLPASSAGATLTFYGLLNENLCTQVNGIPALLVRDVNRDKLADVIVAAPRGNEKRGRVIVLLAEARQ